ncbi:MAG: hypothetical protein EAS51_12165 [Microbacteriaceae bacterium]|nr:MAG: hypothetical protein EAS51_12165 [Microbacteriaceae bacterium]
MRRTPRLVAPTLLAALVLTGCLPSSPAPSPPPTPDADPVFASEEEALAAAEEAYADFLTAVDGVLAAGGIYDGQLTGLATTEVIAQEEQAFASFRSQGWRLTGSSTFKMRIQQFTDSTVVTYSCDDISQTDVLDASGRSVVSPDRPSLVPFEVAFDVTSDGLVIAYRTPWDGGGVC